MSSFNQITNLVTKRQTYIKKIGENLFKFSTDTNFDKCDHVFEYKKDSKKSLIMIAALTEITSGCITCNLSKKIFANRKKGFTKLKIGVDTKKQKTEQTKVDLGIPDEYFTNIKEKSEKDKKQEYTAIIRILEDIYTNISFLFTFNNFYENIDFIRFLVNLYESGQQRKFIETLKELFIEKVSIFDKEYTKVISSDDYIQNSSKFMEKLTQEMSKFLFHHYQDFTDLQRKVTVKKEPVSNYNLPGGVDFGNVKGLIIESTKNPNQYEPRDPLKVWRKEFTKEVAGYTVILGYINIDPSGYDSGGSGISETHWVDYAKHKWNWRTDIFAGSKDHLSLPEEWYEIFSNLTTNQNLDIVTARPIKKDETLYISHGMDHFDSVRDTKLVKNVNIWNIYNENLGLEEFLDPIKNYIPNNWELERLSLSEKFKELPSEDVIGKQEASRNILKFEKLISVARHNLHYLLYISQIEGYNTGILNKLVSAYPELYEYNRLITLEEVL